MDGGPISRLLNVLTRYYLRFPFLIRINRKLKKRFPKLAIANYLLHGTPINTHNKWSGPYEFASRSEFQKNTPENLQISGNSRLFFSEDGKCYFNFLNSGNTLFETLNKYFLQEEVLGHIECNLSKTEIYVNISQSEMKLEGIGSPSIIPVLINGIILFPKYYLTS